MTNAISANGLALIQQHEGFRAEPTQLPDGNWVVGYSHVRVGDAGQPVTESEAADLLTMDIAPVEGLVNAKVTTAVTQAQFDALVSFAFSIGADAFERSQVLRRVNNGDLVAAACAMDAWRKSEVSGELEIVDALVRRRAAEKALFLQDAPVEPSPSVFVRPQLDHAAAILGAPVKYAPAPAVGSIVPPPPKLATVDVITAVLKSEPATETLLLTQVVPPEAVEEGEIVTAHAKPVARTLDSVREATRVAYAEEQKPLKRRFKLFNNERANKIDVVTPPLRPDRRIREMRRRSQALFNLTALNASRAWEFAGLLALLAFGLGLIAAGASVLMQSPQDMVSIGGAAALVAPGIAATLMAAIGFMRAPSAAPVNA